VLLSFFQLVFQLVSFPQTDSGRESVAFSVDSCRGPVSSLGSGPVNAAAGRHFAPAIPRLPVGGLPSSCVVS